MSDNNPTGTYSTHLSGKTAEEVERRSNKSEKSKSRVISELIDDGLHYRNPDIVSETVSQMVVLSLATAVALIITARVIAVAGFVGIEFQIPVSQLFAGSGVTALVGGIGLFAEWAGVPQRVDRMVKR